MCARGFDLSVAIRVNITVKFYTKHIEKLFQGAT